MGSDDDDDIYGDENEEPTLNKNSEGDSFDIYEDADKAKNIVVPEQEPHPNSEQVFEQTLSFPPPIQIEDESVLERASHEIGDTTLWIGNLPWYTTDQTIFNLCSPYGKIFEIKFFEDKQNGKSRGIVVVDFEHKESCFKAIQALQNRVVDTSVIEVTPLNDYITKQYYQDKLKYAGGMKPSALHQTFGRGLSVGVPNHQQQRGPPPQFGRGRGRGAYPLAPFQPALGRIPLPPPGWVPETITKPSEKEYDQMNNKSSSHHSHHSRGRDRSHSHSRDRDHHRDKSRKRDRDRDRKRRRH